MPICSTGGIIFGIKYTPPIPILSNYRIFLAANLNAGYAWAELNFKLRDKTTNAIQFDDKMDDEGILIMASVDVRFQLSQLIAPYLKIGWSTMIYKGEFSENSTNNELIAAIGVRFSIFNTWKLSDQY
ncbi:hypothetical protein ACFL20_06410 [Spirochaetota bacterium]